MYKYLQNCFHILNLFILQTNGNETDLERQDRANLNEVLAYFQRADLCIIRDSHSPDSLCRYISPISERLVSIRESILWTSANYFNPFLRNSEYFGPDPGCVFSPKTMLLFKKYEKIQLKDLRITPWSIRWFSLKFIKILF